MDVSTSQTLSIPLCSQQNQMLHVQRKVLNISSSMIEIVYDLGYILWGIEIVGSGNITIRIFIDHENGVSVDDCQIRRQ